ncbi:cytochrome-c oxidase, cbb3-type subunit III [Rhizobium sp. TRM96647]|uniref:cytochrome-c oxidase, cbb3-type subunit III n=1 Tax=unclassified Rhizobium TaxID=2613769 RepID=UPI0021E96085|nr:MULTISPECIES: cytochrome-c oxidase, cbb3-type subunit III [unclassified Rhizobium]MCV3736971.1 cytochrome-c oxidase, cbb3-type subunit III [Rhizobium sp. TRM96647]MCV3756629.1 cytochrome-c oxidase, cbb3-type subunit III [Rhizobium sp. TRM96650]
MAVGERDPVTGHMTTGHEWNGIKELHTPVPRPVWFFLIAFTLFGVVWSLLMPSWPYGTGYFGGWLGIDQKQTVAKRLDEGVAERAAWAARIESEDYSAILADADLMPIVRETGHTLFGDNCAACHGVGGGGNGGYPNIVAAPTLWGDDPATIAETIRVGINGADPETRVSQMMAFGRDQVLERPAILQLVTYVRSLSGLEEQTEANTAAIEAGRELFAQNCAACHGEDAKGLKEVGAPDLTDHFWIYGSGREAVYQSVYGGRQGHMPSWGLRLSPLDIKILALYVADLREQQHAAGGDGT